MANPLIVPVILSGGSGVRLWPLSREKNPKQFLSLVSDKSLFSDTISRVKGAPFSEPLIVCSENHRFLVAESLQNDRVKNGFIILEPCSRNTAPAIGVAAEMVASKRENALILVVPSDHIITNNKAFLSAVKATKVAAENGDIVSLAIRAERPEPGYGYIKQGVALSSSKNFFKVDNFVEKPNRSLAEKLIKSGKYFWNSGIYLLRVDVLLKELALFQPKILDSAKLAVKNGEYDLCFFRLNKEAFERSPSVSIDHAIIEKTDRAVAIEVDMGWSDLGSWQALRKLGKSDTCNNVNIGDGTLLNCKNVYARSEGPLISALGVEDLNIVATDDSVLVIPNDRADEVREIVKDLQTKKRSEHKEHSRVHRPWGSYQNLRKGDGYLVKEIIVNPGARLSLQYHEHRAEHWVVVEGQAKVTQADDEFLLSVNQSIYIPQGAKHRIENSGETILRIIEIQSGNYINEDDIIRIEDDFGRDEKNKPIL